MPISDWSSDVCSSDLHVAWLLPAVKDLEVSVVTLREAEGMIEHAFALAVAAHGHQDRSQSHGYLLQRARAASASAAGPSKDRLHGCDCSRSEEHTSALQSLMRISYAFFCLKKTK